jgi:putative NADPH-quinone reductase
MWCLKNWFSHIFRNFWFGYPANGVIFKSGIENETAMAGRFPQKYQQ